MKLRPSVVHFAVRSLLVFGFWPLAFGFWLLAFGVWRVACGAWRVAGCLGRCCKLNVD
jgi:hypothetical protein